MLYGCRIDLEQVSCGAILLHVRYVRGISELRRCSSRRRRQIDVGRRGLVTQITGRRDAILSDQMGVPAWVGTWG